MKTTDKLDKLAPALVKAQSEMGGALKDSNNPFFKSKYADLTSVWKCCKTALHDNGFSIIQSPIYKDDRIGVSTMLLHETGQYITDEYTLSVKKQNDPQADGSSITYARRYALAAFVGVCPVDDDGELAMARNTKKKTSYLMSKSQSDKLIEFCKMNDFDHIKIATAYGISKEMRTDSFDNTYRQIEAHFKANEIGEEFLLKL